MTSFFDYEKANNVLIKTLRENYKDLIKVITRFEASILAPQSVNLENIEITRDFIEAHLIIVNPRNSLQWVSLNGILGVFSAERETLFVLDQSNYNQFDPRSPKLKLDPLLTDLSDLFESERSVFDQFLSSKNISSNNMIHVLREGTVSFEDGKCLVPLILISEPLLYLGRACSGNTKVPSVLPETSLSDNLSNGFSRGTFVRSMPATATTNSPVSIDPLYHSSSPGSIFLAPENNTISALPISSSISMSYAPNTTLALSTSISQSSVASTPKTSSTETISSVSSTTSLASTSIVNSLSTIASLSSSFLSSAVQKPKGIMDFLSQYGASPTASPLFPDNNSSDNNASTLDSFNIHTNTANSTSAINNNYNDNNNSNNNNNNSNNNVSSMGSNSGGTKFLFFQKLKHPSATDIVKALKSFENSFLQHPPSSMQQQSILVRTTLDSIEKRILEHPLWKDAEEEEIDSIEEGLEKYMMTKLFSVTFTAHCSSHENSELTKRIIQLQFIEFQHLDIKPYYRNDVSIQLALNELLKINQFKTPRDKLICVWNCCKVIYNILHRSNPEHNPSGADDFLPLLIYAVIKSNPKYLYTNVEYISLFRHSSKMLSEMGYYFTHLVSAIQFIRTIESKSLSIDPELFKKNMERHIPPSPIPNEIESKTEPMLAKSSRSISLLDLSLEESNATMSSPSACRNSTATISSSDASSFSTSNTIANLSEEVLYPFLGSSLEQLRIADLDLLLKQYKQLVIENRRLKMLLEQSNLNPNQQEQQQKQ